MKIQEIKDQAHAMPFSSPAYPKGPYRFINREYFIIKYETDIEALRAVVPEPLEVTEPVVAYEFIRMPDSSGFGDYTESGQVIPVSYQGEKASYVHSMYLDDHAPIAGGREIWGFPKKLAQPTLAVVQDTLIGTVNYGPIRVATGTMGFKYEKFDLAKAKAALSGPTFLLKIIPHVDGTARVCELVRYQLTEVEIKGAWSGPAALELSPHALAPVAELPVKKIVSALHIVSDLTLPYGEVAYDYLKN